jgi:hypothetical protein
MMSRVEKEAKQQERESGKSGSGSERIDDDVKQWVGTTRG